MLSAISYATQTYFTEILRSFKDTFYGTIDILYETHNNKAEKCK